jgi:hypothetical protein
MSAGRVGPGDNLAKPKKMGRPEPTQSGGEESKCLKEFSASSTELMKAIELAGVVQVTYYTLHS